MHPRRQPGAPEQNADGVLHVGEWGFAQWLARGKNHVPSRRHILPLLADGLTQTPANAVANNSIPQSFTNRKSTARYLQTVGKQADGQKTVCPPSPLGANGLTASCLAQMDSPQRQAAGLAG